MGQLNETVMPDVVAGVDIGGTKVLAILVDDEGSVKARGVVPAPAGAGGAAMADAASQLVRRLVGESRTRLVSTGVGAAGVIDSERGVIRAASMMFTEWAGFALADEMAHRLGVPVRIENDVNAFLMGEVASGKLGHNVLGIMLGTGVGGAVVLDGVLRHGPHGSAGEIGHTPGYSDIVCTCGQVGHLETMASGVSIGLRYGEATGIRGLGAGEVARRARSGDVDALMVFSAAGRAVAMASVGAAGLLDLDMVVIGGGVSHAWDLLQPSIAATLGTDSPVSGVTLSIERSKLGEDAVAIGAAAAARIQLNARSAP